MGRSTLLVTAAAVSVLSHVGRAAPTTLPPPTDLRIEGLLEREAVISNPNPRFTFTVPPLPTGVFGVTLASVRVVVTSTAGAVVWNSGSVATQSPALLYTGPDLLPFAQYRWEVEVNATAAGLGTLVSAAATARFETGPITAKDWGNASWIGSHKDGPDQFRFEFDLPAGTVEWARVYVASAGCAAVLVNSQVPAIDLRGMCPWSVGGYASGQNVRYMTHDVTHAVTAGGRNAVGLLGGNVMVSNAAVIAIVAVSMAPSPKIAQANVETAAAPLLWTTGSPGWQMRGASFYGTATAWNSALDLRLEESGWAAPGFVPKAGSTWGPATYPDPTYPRPLRALQMPLSAVLEEVQPVQVEALPGGDFLYTFPKNFVGTVKIPKLPSAADGSSLLVTSGEWLVDTAPAPPSPPAPPAPPATGQCALVKEKSAITATCPAGHTIYDVIFASFGTPTGSCDSGFAVDSNCNAENSTEVVRAACVGKQSCTIPATAQFFNVDPCNGVVKALAVEVGCVAPAPCGQVPENTPLQLACPAGQVITDVPFASFGTPTGSCASGFAAGKCNAPASLSTVKAQCVGKNNCTVFSSNAHFEGDPCNDVVKTLAASVTCGHTALSAGVRQSVRNGRVVTHVDPLPPLPPAGNGTWPQISGKVQTTQFTLRADNPNDIETYFCWHGFQYVRITPNGSTGFQGQLNDIVGLAIHTNMTQTGFLDFGGDGVAGSASEQAAEVLTGINSMTLQSQRTNVAAYIPTDCPTREKHGWMGDALDASEQAMYNFFTLAMHTAFMQSIEDNQGVDGDVPVVIPVNNPRNGSCGDIAWTSAYPQITNMLHTYYGDDRVVAWHWKSLVAYQENLIQHAAQDPSGIAECDQFKDWLCGNQQSCCSNGPTGSTCPVGAEMGAFNYVLGLRSMATMAALQGDSVAVARYNSSAATATGLFHKAFWVPEMEAYGGDAGAVQSLSTPALVIDSPPPDLYPHVLDTLAMDLNTTTSYHPMIGAVTSKVLLDVLSENGLHETALRTATTTTAPSWGFWWARNSSTCWESWPLATGHGHGTVNHIFLCGGVGEWMWKYLVGVTPKAPGFRQVQVHPRVHPIGPASLAGSYHSAAGVIDSAWRLTEHGSAVELNTSLPLGVASATIVVPKPFVAGPGANGTVCEHASEDDGGVLELSCPAGAQFASVVSAYFGTPNVAGDCSSWSAGSCNAPTSQVVATVAKLCVGKPSCSIAFGDGAGRGNSSFPIDPCNGTVKTLAVHATCTATSTYTPTTTASVLEGGVLVWDGAHLVGSHPGIVAARDLEDGVAFDVVNGAFQFVAHPTA